VVQGYADWHNVIDSRRECGMGIAVKNCHKSRAVARRL
jgi:hypothetical protein